MENILKLEKSQKISIAKRGLKEHEKGFMILIPFIILIGMFLISPFVSVFIGSFLNEFNEVTLENYEYILKSKFIKQ